MWSSSAVARNERARHPAFGRRTPSSAHHSAPEVCFLHRRARTCRFARCRRGHGQGTIPARPLVVGGRRFFGWLRRMPAPRMALTTRPSRGVLSTARRSFRIARPVRRPSNAPRSRSDIRRSSPRSTRSDPHFPPRRPGRTARGPAAGSPPETRAIDGPTPNPSLQRTIPGRSPGYCR